MKYTKLISFTDTTFFLSAESKITINNSSDPPLLSFPDRCLSAVTHELTNFQKSSSEWENVCLGVLNRKIHIWNDMLLVPINEHVKKIISSYIEDAIMTTTTDVTEILQSYSEVIY